MLTHHVFIPWWGEFSHHCLGKSIEWCLEKAENDIVRPTQKFGNRFCIKRYYIPEFPDIMEAIKKLVQNCNANRVIKTHPILLVQIPSMPQNGIKIAIIVVVMS